MSKMKKRNMIGKHSRVKAITTRKTLRRYQYRPQQQAEQKARAIKRLLHFDLVSDLENVNMDDYLGSFESIYKNEVNGINDLITFATAVAKERGITKPCLAWLELDRKRYLLVDEDFVILNASEVITEDNFESDCYSEKGNTPFGWTHLNIKEYYRKEVVVKPENYDYCLTSISRLKNDVYCGINESEECADYCEFYNICNAEIVGITYYYIKAIR